MTLNSPKIHVKKIESIDEIRINMDLPDGNLNNFWLKMISLDLDGYISFGTNIMNKDMLEIFEKIKSENMTLFVQCHDIANNKFHNRYVPFTDEEIDRLTRAAYLLYKSGWSTHQIWK